MARPLRFRHDTGEWDEHRVRGDLLAPLDENLGAEASTPWFAPPSGYEARRFDMANGDTALFCWTTTAEGRPGEPAPSGGAEAFWLGNTETPSTLWRTEKYTFAEVPYGVARWAQRELLAELHDAEPWLAAYPHLSWFFLPVFCSKDGRTSTRAFFAEHAAGFPDADRAAGAAYYEDVLHSGVLDDYRHVMAGKLGTSASVNLTRMRAAMAEFTVAGLLDDAGYEVRPEVEVATGHSIDFRAGTQDGTGVLVEVTRPKPPAQRAAADGPAAVRDTADTKTGGQLAEHGGGVVLFVDCSSFDDGTWKTVRDARPAVGHRPAVVFRARPDGSTQGYALGSVPLEVDGLLARTAAR